MAGFINIESLCALLWRPGVALSARQTKRALFPLSLCERSPFVLKLMSLCDRSKRRLMMSIVRSDVSEELRGLSGGFCLDFCPLKAVAGSRSYRSAAGKAICHRSFFATYQTAPLRDEQIARDNPSHRGCHLWLSQNRLYFLFRFFTLLIPCACFGALAQKCGAVDEKLGVEQRQLPPPNAATSVSSMLGCLSTINL